MSRPRPSVLILSLLCGWVGLTGSGVLIAKSLPSVPDEIEVHHSVEVRLEAETSHKVELDLPMFRFGNLRVDVPNMPVIP